MERLGWQREEEKRENRKRERIGIKEVIYIIEIVYTSDDNDVARICNMMSSGTYAVQKYIRWHTNRKKLHTRQWLLLFFEN